MPGILASIVETKHGELESLRARREALERSAAAAPPPRDFRSALAGGDAVSLVAECKRRSPGAGAIRPGLDPVALTLGYQRAGASALSVLTDVQYFGGSLADLEAVRAAVDIPVLRKDFTVDPLHVVEARGAGADAVLLIVRILDDARLRELLGLAADLGMGALVEAHDAAEVRRALEAGADIVGINNRDLATFTTDLETTLRLLDQVPPGVVVVSESGIRHEADVARLGLAGVDAVLVGETLLRADDPAAAAGLMSGVARRGRGA
ncbi:MAG TPA: indole-3-glycerol phosphate synthase TrpC [Longimicrobiales bacterium]|nr:indole-3-glycerol phosphate synthase TrpC [Longimicrobiales bacterium]